MNGPGIREFQCQTCQSKVVYDPDDPLHQTSGALLRKTGPAKLLIVYLTCGNGHVHRYGVG